MLTLRTYLLASVVIGIATSAVGPTSRVFSTRLFYDGSHVSLPVAGKDVSVVGRGDARGGHRLFGTQNPVRMLQEDDAVPHAERPPGNHGQRRRDPGQDCGIPARLSGRRRGAAG